MEVNSKYLKALLKRSQQGDVTWGHTGNAIPILERWLLRLKDGQCCPYPPKTLEEMWWGLEDRGVPSWEIAALKEVKYIREAPKPEKPKVTFTKEHLQSLKDAAGVSVYFLRVRPNGPYTPKEDLEYLIDTLPDLDLFVEELKAWTKAFAGIARFPKIQKVFDKYCRTLILDPTQRGTADASWRGHDRSVVLRLGNVMSTNVPYLRSILIHEIGHMLTEDPNFNRVDFWLNKTLYGNPPYISDYAKKNSDEDFAETYRSFWTDPARLKQVSPDKYKDMKQRVASRWLKQI